MLIHRILTQEDQDRWVTCNIRSICNDHAGITEPSAGTLQALKFSDISYILQGFLPQLFYHNISYISYISQKSKKCKKCNAQSWSFG